MNFIQTGNSGKNDWWLYVFTVLIVMLGTQIGSIPLMIVAFFKAGDTQTFYNAALDNFGSLNINKNLYLILMLLTFIIGFILLLFCVKYLHKKTTTSIITSRKKIDWKRFFFGVFTWGIISVITITLGIILSPESYEWNFKAGPFFTLLLISVLLIPTQTSLEELLFRGYLMQGFGLLSKSPFFALVLTSTIFGLLHLSNPEVAKVGNWIMVYYIGTGFFFGIVTLMDKGTELALGMHAINNILASVFVTANWTVFHTDALFIDYAEPSLGIDTFLPVIVLYPLLIVVFAKKYKWTNWREKLIG
ncbi:CPBP family intramembrane glutamic endopeptidase [Aureivirga sp. CE67]|uniref:CPBP family intramembrane glutamic endopeptidase n=1 Tax=Aureivirga sp. CE67 TaxID=1788983 RepID=UPI0018C9B075|nr:CPBP family intramembrane glutamic endopeptidase [Aureivirga sp. CE67]